MLPKQKELQMGRNFLHLFYSLQVRNYNHKCSGYFPFIWKLLIKVTYGVYPKTYYLLCKKAHRTLAIFSFSCRCKKSIKIPLTLWKAVIVPFWGYAVPHIGQDIAPYKMGYNFNIKKIIKFLRIIFSSGSPHVVKSAAKEDNMAAIVYTNRNSLVWKDNDNIEIDQAPHSIWPGSAPKYSEVLGLQSARLVIRHTGQGALSGLPERESCEACAHQARKIILLKPLGYVV